jgi:uncharacterized repeat protein (TIGR03803 family)
MVRAASGLMYGTTAYRGQTSCYSGLACGVVFSFSTSGVETVLYQFAPVDSYGSGPDPRGLVMGADGNVYGVTSGGGDFGRGTLFKLTTAVEETTLHSFAGTVN